MGNIYFWGRLLCIAYRKKVIAQIVIANSRLRKYDCQQEKKFFSFLQAMIFVSSNFVLGRYSLAFSQFALKVINAVSLVK